MRFLLLAFVLFVSSCGDKHEPAPRPRELVILTRAASTADGDKASGTTGFDSELVRMLAQELGMPARLVVADNEADIIYRLQTGDAQMAAAWQVAVKDLRSSEPYFYSHNVLVTPDASLPLRSVEQLANKTVHVVAGSRQEAALRRVKLKIAGLKIVASRKRTELDLMEGVANRQYEAALVNNAEFDIGSNYYPELQASLIIGSPRPIVWLFAPGVDAELVSKSNAFLKRIEANGEMDRLKDSYFGHVDRLTPADSVRFIGRMRSVLPRYRDAFRAAQTRTGIDWRLLAALAYQESQWDPLATSPTGVRGLMMLTADTADELGVTNRLDPEQSIRAGAQYLGGLRDALPPSVGERDRLSLALAAYNLGMGHLNAARHIAQTRNANPDSWYEMKKVLPLLAKPQYYSRLKSGKGRGGEAVIMAENVRIYHDILNRYEPAYRPVDRFTTTPMRPTPIKKRR